MRKLSSILTTLVVLGVVAWGLTFRSTYQDNMRELASLRLVVDSIRSIEAMPPDTITITKDTTIYKDSIIYRNRKFEDPQPEDTVIHYRDSLVNDKIRAWVDIYADQVFDIEWQYQPVFKNTITTIREPYPIVVEKPIKVTTEASGIYATGGIGFGEGFVGRIGLGYMPDSRKMYGIEVMRVGDQTIYGISAAIKLFH